MTRIKVRQVAHVCIFARDLEETRGFYADVLGMEVAFRFLRDGQTFGFYLDAGGRSHVEVFLKPEAGWDELNRINHFCLEVESIDDAVAHIRGRGIEVTGKKLGATTPGKPGCATRTGFGSSSSSTLGRARSSWAGTASPTGEPASRRCSAA